MTVAAWEDLLKQTEHLPRKDRLKLAAHLIKTVHPSALPEMKWKDIRGLLPCPALGEDAQTWVTRNRAASDSRESQWVGK